MTNLFKNHHAILCTLLIGITLFASCSKDGAGDYPTPEKQADVYVAGEEFTGGQYVATLWKNGVATSLGSGVDESTAHNVFVSGSDVYVAGYERNTSGNRVAKIWENGVATNLTDGANKAEALVIFVSGNDVYVGGYEVMGGTSRGKIWKNAKLYWTAPLNTFKEINCIYVKGTDLYVAGFIGSGPQYYWINPTAKAPTIVKVLDLEGINSLVVSGDDIYICGNKGKTARYLKNNQVINLTDGSKYAVCSSLFLSGSMVYSVGYEANQSGNHVAKLWKNETAIDLSATDGTIDVEANAVYLWNNKWYAAGHDISHPVVWEDGTPKVLAKKGFAYSVFVVDKK